MDDGNDFLDRSALARRDTCIRNLLGSTLVCGDVGRQCLDDWSEVHVRRRRFLLCIS